MTHWPRAPVKEDRVPLVQLVVTLIIVGVLLWAVNNFIPMDPKIRQILNVVVVIAVVLWLLRVFGVLDSGAGIRVGAAAPLMRLG